MVADGPAGAAVKTRLAARLPVSQLDRVRMPRIVGTRSQEALAVIPRRAIHRRLAARCDILRASTPRKEQECENDETRTKGLNARKHGGTSV